MALVDWESFHNACSFMTGLQLALDEGVQDSNSIKLLKLNQSYHELTATWTAAACNVEANSKNALCASLGTRIGDMASLFKVQDATQK